MRTANLLALLLMMAGLGSKASALPVGYDWHQYGEHYYSLSVTYGNWLDIEAEAESQKGYLVSINDAAENAWLDSVFGGLPLYIGLRQLPGSAEPKGGWTWISGEALTYTNWDSNQPDNFTGQDNYGMINPTLVYLNTPNKWHDVPLEGWQPTSYHRGIIEIPEPASLFLLALYVLMMIRRRSWAG